MPALVDTELAAGTSGGRTRTLALRVETDQREREAYERRRFNG